MRNLITISELIGEIYELVKDECGSFPKVARSVKTAVQDMAFYSNTMIGVRSKIVLVSDNLTAELPDDCAGVLKVAKIQGKACILFDRAEQVPTKESYALREKDFPKCNTCTCEVKCETTTVNYKSLPDAMDMQTVCTGVRFHNCGNLPTLSACYVKNYGTYVTDGNRLYLSNVKIGDEILVEYKKEIDAETYQLIPRDAFDAILYKAKTYLEPTNYNNQQLFRTYKKRFDLLKARESYTIESIFRALQK